MAEMTKRPRRRQAPAFGRKTEKLSVFSANQNAMAEKTESCQRPGRQRPGRQRPGRQRPGRQRPGRQLAEVSTNWGCCGAASSPRAGPAAGRSRAGGVSKIFCFFIF